MKTCKKCQIEKDESEFSPDRRNKDGLQARCKKCANANRRPLTAEEKVARKAYHAEWRKKNREEENRKRREKYARDPSGWVKRQEKYESANPEKVRQTKANYRERNREYLREKGVEYHLKNRDAANARIREWARRNKHKRRHYDALRNAQEKMATPPWLTKEHKAQILAVYELAERLTRETGELHHVDHIFPLRGKNCSGLHVPWNLQAIPAKENLRKSNKVVAEPTLMLGAV